MENNAKDGLWKRKKSLLPIFLILVILLFLFIGYRNGYRVSNFSIGKTGMVTIDAPLPLTYIFIDESRKIVTSKDNEKVNLSLSPRKHSVIVSRDGYFPWKKDFYVSSNAALALAPLYVSQNATGEIITQNDPEYASIRNSLQDISIPTQENPKVSIDGATKLWLEENAIMLSSGSTTSIVIQPDTLVRNIEFYKGRNDAVIFSTSDSVYVIEVRSEDGQNFMPIYRGQSPIFRKASENSLFIWDANNLMEVVI